MTQLPPHFLSSLRHVQGFDKEAFEAVHASGETVTSIRINPSKPHSVLKDEYVGASVPWCDTGYYLSERPSFTFDPFFTQAVIMCRKPPAWLSNRLSGN